MIPGVRPGNQLNKKPIALRRARNTLCAPGALMEGTVPKGRFPLYRHFISSARSYGARMHFVRAESPFDSRCPARESIKQKNNRAPQSAKYSLRAWRAHGGNRPERTVPPLPELCPASHFVPHVGRGRGKPIRQVGLHERPLAAGVLRGCGRAFYFWLSSFSPRRK